MNRHLTRVFVGNEINIGRTFWKPPQNVVDTSICNTGHGWVLRSDGWWWGHDPGPQLGIRTREHGARCSVATRWGRQFKMTYSDTLCKMTYSDTLYTGSSWLRHWKQRLYLLSSCAAGLADSIIIMRSLRVREGWGISTDISLMEVNIIFAMFLCKTYSQ